MVGILVQLALSWAILWLLERKHLNALGFTPNRTRLVDFLLFVTVTGIICASGFGLKMMIAQQKWILNASFTPFMLAEGAWWNTKSVLFEELIFRGALFFVIMQRFGSRHAIWISAVSFGVYHWFSHGTFGNPQAMFWDFVITGAMGLVLGYGFARSGSLYIPVAIHFGWNFVQSSVFSGGVIGNQLFVEVLPRPEVTVSVAAYLFMTFFPLITVLLANAWLIRVRTISHIPQIGEQAKSNGVTFKQF